MTAARSAAKGPVLVTGGRRGIGRAIACALAEAGHDVVINDIVEDEAARETREAIAAHGRRSVFLRGDIADTAAQERLIADAFAAFGSLDGLVNNAGVSVARRGDMLETTPESYDRLMAINLRGPFFLTQAVARRWLAEGSRPRLIVNIASANSDRASIDRAEYCLSKAGITMMTKLYALRLAEAGIGVFEIRPGVIRTDMTAVAAERYDALIASGLTPIRRWGEPEDIGRAVAALASGQFAFSTGEVINVDGGLHIARL